MNMVFIAGMLFSCILMITFLSYLYFKQKRLYNASSKVFGALLIFILLCVIIDFHTCIPEINQKTKTYAYTFTVYFLYIISTLLSLATIVIYCFINTCNRFRYKSELIITCLSIPFFYSLVKLVYFISTKNFITMQGEFPAMTYDTFNLIVFDYVVYGIMIIFMAVVMKKGKRTISEILVNILLIAECIIAISYARRTGTFLASIFLAFNICILYATIQSPKSCVDQRLKCFDSKALDIMFQEYAARKKNYYMFTINIVNYRYYQVKYNLDFAEKLLQTLRNKMPKDSDKTTSFKYNDEVFITLTTDKKDFEIMLEYSKDHLNEKWNIDEIEVPLSFQINYFYKDFSKDNENMILYLDRIINYQKKDPSSRITCINEIQGFMNRESLVLKALRNAIRNDSLKVYIQPIWSVKNKRFEKGEILARLIDEHLGFISPSEFIPLAEEWNLINDVTKQITYKTIQAMKKYDFKYLGVDNLNVNFSSLELSNTNIAYLIKDLLNEYNLKTENLTIEVTETADSISEKRMESNLEIFHELGFKLALDDFGTGYSNIERVLSMPFDYIKIDKSLLDHAKDSKINNILLRKNIEMLKECGYHIVVEGVEFDEQVKLLSDHNVDYIQGFYYSRPIPIEDFADLLRSSKNVRT